MGDVTLTGVYNSGCETEYRGSQNDVTRQGNIEVKIQEVKLRDSSAAEESLQSIPRSQKMGKTACVTLMYLCEVMKPRGPWALKSILNTYWPRAIEISF